MTADNAELVIVELLLPSGTPFRRSKPMTQLRAEEVSKLYADTFDTAIVPVEKYQGKVGKTESLENIATNNGYRSKVE